MSAIGSKSFYQKAKKQLVAVDCIIFGFESQQLELLLFKRKIEPFKDQWSLIGSFVNSDESVKGAAARVLRESTGLENVFLEALGCYGEVNRDEGARVISLAHYSLIRLDDYKEEQTSEFEARWFKVDEIPNLVIDHNRMVADALNKLRRKSRYQPIGFELLPRKFTIPQLKEFYDAIHQKTLDRRNFRKKILNMKILEKLDEKDKSFSKKGAFLYQFDKIKYEKLLAKGFNFEL